MGNHRVASTAPRAGNVNGSANGSVNGTVNQAAPEAPASPPTAHFQSPSALTLRNWPVSWRLIAVIVLALLMGLVFGGLRVASAASSADEFGHVSQLAVLGQQVTGLVQVMENERDETTGLLPINSTNIAQLNSAYNATDAAAAKVQSLAAGIGGSFPANIQARVAAVLSDIAHLKALRAEAQASQSALAVISAYSTPITNMIALNGQIAQGTSDATLVNDVQTLNSLSLAKDQASQQRAILFNSFNQQIFADGELQALQTAESEELTDLTAFDTTATPAELSAYSTSVNKVSGKAVNEAQNIEIYVVGTGVPNIGAGALNIDPKQAPGAWYSAQSAKVEAMQKVELGVAQNIVARAQSLQNSAKNDALFTAIVTAIILLLVLLATIAVARSLVRPLRKLREGALNIATVELPERVRLLGEAQDPSTSLEVQPIDVLSTDEIGQVARAFDQVHSEAVRLASNEASLRNSFNAMFVNLSRRSQSLIERLVRMIDSLEQNEGDPERLSNLFAMDHLVTRMRRNSENLLLLAGHESARKWSDPVSLADVARASVSEIEQYSRVTLKIQPGIAVAGPAVSDVVHLLAEVIENATIFSAKDTPVHVAAQELTSGGVLIEVSDNGVGVPDARLAEMNWRLDNPPVMDVSVSRHMGLFAVARLAERHGVRVRLRPRAPHGLTALVWLPDSVTEREASLYGARSRTFAAQAGFPSRGTTGTAAMPVRSVPDAQPANHRRDVIVPEPVATGPRETVSAGAAPSSGVAVSDWFRSRPSSTTGNGNGNGSVGLAPPSTPPSSAPLPTAPLQTAGLPTAGLLPTAGPLPTAPLPTALSTAAVPDVRGQFSGPSGSDGWAVGKHAAQIIAEPVRGDFTAAGLPTRVPQANLIPGSAGGGRASGGGGGSTGRPGPGPEAQTPAAPRSPDVARSRLSGFQRGVRRAKDQTPDSGEGADS